MYCTGHCDSSPAQKLASAIFLGQAASCSERRKTKLWVGANYARAQHRRRWADEHFLFAACSAFVTTGPDPAAMRTGGSAAPASRLRAWRDIGAIGFHRARRQLELARDFLVAQALDDARGHVALASDRRAGGRWRPASATVVRGWRRARARRPAPRPGTTSSSTGFAGTRWRLEGAAAQVDVGVARQHDHRQVRLLRQPRQHVQAADARHADVQHHAADGLGRQRIQEGDGIAMADAAQADAARSQRVAPASSSSTR